MIEIKDGHKGTRMAVNGKIKSLCECSSFELDWLWYNKPKPERFLINTEPDVEQEKPKIEPLPKYETKQERNNRTTSKGKFKGKEQIRH